MRILSLFIFAVLLAGCGQRSSDDTAQTAQAEAMTTSIRVPTIQCNMCVSNITKALEATDGVTSASVDLDTKTATVQFLEAKVDLNQLEMAIANAGYDANDTKKNLEAYDNLAGCCKIDG